MYEMAKKVCCFELGFRGVGILLGMIFMGVSYGVVEGNLVAGQKSLEVGRNVDALNRHAVKTIQVSFLLPHFRILFYDS